MFFDSGREIHDVYISKPGIFELANIEMELFNHCPEASNPQLHVCVFHIDLIVAVITGKEF